MTPKEPAPVLAQGPFPRAVDPPTGAGGWLGSVEGTTLPLVGARVAATAAGGLAEVVLEQRFRNGETTPVDVVYVFPLPFDAAVVGYTVAAGHRRIVGEIDRVEAARQRFEQALLEGRLSALVEQSRSSLFRQELGRIPPGEEVVVTLTLEQKLRWLDEGAWEWRFPTTVGPRYLGEDGRQGGNGGDGGHGGGPGRGDAEVVARGPLGARIELALDIRDAVDGTPESPSHRIRSGAAAQSWTVELESSSGGMRLDRDLVVRWQVQRHASGLSLEVARPPAGSPQGEAAHGLLTIVPPAAPSPSELVTRDLVVLLDTSGSMAEEPLRQARRVVAALVDSLNDHDQVELIEFSRMPRRWREGPVSATPEMKRDALVWLAGLQAGGGTEMRQGIEEALRPLRQDSQRQVVLVTDGLIGAEARVVRSISDGLPPGSRLHTVGVGSSVNRSLTGPAARAGRGVEVVVGLGEDAERAAGRLVARTAAPLVVDLTIEGPALYTHAPQRLPDLFTGAPVLVGLALRAEGGSLTVEGRTARGRWRQTVEVAATAPGTGRPLVTHLYGRERVEDLETAIAAGEEAAPLEREIERLGLELQLSTRLTSWVAISEDKVSDGGGATRRLRMPQELPAGMSIEALGLRHAMDAPAVLASMPVTTMAPGATRATEGRRGQLMPRPPATTWQGPPPVDLSSIAGRRGSPSRPRAAPPGAAWAGSLGVRRGAPIGAGRVIVRGFIPPGAREETRMGGEGGGVPAAAGRVSQGDDLSRAPGGRRILHGWTLTTTPATPHPPGGGGLTITFMVDDGALEWRIGTEVELLGREGQRAPAKVVRSRPPGTVADGEQVQIVVLLPPDLDWSICEVAILGGPQVLLIVL